MNLPCMDAGRKIRTSLCWMALVFFVPLAWSGELVFVTHALLPSVRELAQQTAERSGKDVRVALADEPLNAAKTDAVILVGPQALVQWQGAENIPAIAVFVSREVVRQSNAGLTSAVYLEPPLLRQLELAKNIIGTDYPFGVLVADNEQWQSLGIKNQHLLVPYFTADYPSLNYALQDLLKTSPALIGIYDPQLYSSANIKNILITAYRHNKPLIGPSSAYIKAGAMATTYSDISDIAARLSDIVSAGLSTGHWPAADYNPYFKVKYNQQVARSLNLLLPDAGQLAERLLAQEKAQ